MYDPDAPGSAAWSGWAEYSGTRAYHSTALLLPDGRIFLGGGTFPSREPSIEIMRPPYLFDSSDHYLPSSRPVITNWPSKIYYDESFNLTLGGNYADQIQQVNLIRLGAATHGFDQDTRFIPLTFSGDSNKMTVAGPENAQLAPPGYYMLFVLRTGDRAGVLFPSIAKVIRVGTAE